MMGLLKAYFGERVLQSVGRVRRPPAASWPRRPSRRVQSGGDWQRLAALALLAAADQDEAARDRRPNGRRREARRLAAGRRLPDPVGRPRRQGVRAAALAALRGHNAARKKHRPETIGARTRATPRRCPTVSSAGQFRRRLLYVSFRPRRNADRSQAAARASRPSTSARWSADADPEVAASAGYLLALLGEPDGMPPLLRYWREHAESPSDWDRLGRIGQSPSPTIRNTSPCCGRSTTSSTSTTRASSTGRSAS